MFFTAIWESTLAGNFKFHLSCFLEEKEPKIRLMRSLVTSVFLYASGSWTLTAELQRRIQAMEMMCYRKILRISYKDHVTNEEVRAKIQQSIGPHRRETQTAVVWSCLPFIRSGQNHLAKHNERGKRQGRQRKRWEGDTRE